MSYVTKGEGQDELNRSISDDSPMTYNHSKVAV